MVIFEFKNIKISDSEYLPKNVIFMKNNWCNTFSEVAVYCTQQHADKTKKINGIK